MNQATSSIGGNGGIKLLQVEYGFMRTGGIWSIRVLILTRLQLRLADAHTFTCEWRSCAFADTNIDIDTGYSSALPTPTPSQASLVCLFVSGQSLLCLFCVVVDLSYDFVCEFFNCGFALWSISPVLSCCVCSLAVDPSCVFLCVF